MFKKIVDVIKEVFWLKPSKKKRSTSKKSAGKSGKKTKPKVIKKAVAKKAVVKKVAVKKAQAVVQKVSKLPVIKAEKPVKAPKIKKPLVDPSLTEIGEITHYFDRIKVAVLSIKAGSVLIGDKIHIIGPKTKLLQKLWSMQIDRVDVKVAKQGEEIGFKVEKTVAVGDKVYK